MRLLRREFLQQAGGMLAALGIGGAGWLRLGDRYLEALAQPTARKLALLVGVDRYPDSPLRGCVTDVELQRELLLYRFGFDPSDILTLTDSQATRENIETAFATHLIQQAKPGDSVVFHFSGCGSRISLGQVPEVMQNSLVPVDDVSPSEGNPTVNDILEETLLLLLRSLPTQNAVAILDTGYTYPGSDKNGSFRIRSRPRHTVGQPSREELALMSLIRSRANTPSNAAIFAAAAPSQLAAEREWNGFAAGLFTYALTQTLWEATPATRVQVSFSRAAGTVEQATGLSQQPQIRSQSPLLPANLPADFANSRFNSPAADGAVTAVEDGGKTVQLWLGGLPSGVLDSCSGSVFAAVNSQDRLLLRGRTGLSAKAQVLERSIGSSGQLALGELVREEIRVFPRNIGLTVALDSGLERIERVDATSAIATVPQVSAVPGDRPADCRFGRLPSATVAQIPETPLPGFYQSRYGLFSLGDTPISNTDGDGGEAVKVAVQRLIPQLKTLLAEKLLRLTVNEASSRLKVRAVLATLSPQSRVVEQREPLRADRAYQLEALSDEGEKSPHPSILSVPTGSRIQYRLYNESDRPVYAAVFSSDTGGRLLLVNSHGENGAGVMSEPIAPGETASVPAAGSFGWAVSGPAGIAETLVIFSEKKFDRTLAALEGGMQQVRNAEPVRVLLNPLDVARAVLEDLHEASVLGVQKVGLSTDDLALDVNVWAGLSFVYRVV
ncbi:MAG: caspase family protein [Richelia sp. CSU_2_1]|nr:caspase family protein [Richelia sp. CSU_2_1]